jgi:23S rRNA (uracil1939-C5)-methyltransferase
VARAFCAEHQIPLYDPRDKRGLLRELVVRVSAGTGEVMVGSITSSGSNESLLPLAERLAAVDPRITSIVRGVSTSVSDAAPIERTSVLRGKSTITERARGLTFQIGIDTFFQTNTAQAENLIDIVRQQAGAAGRGFAIDLYCGVGFFSLALADRFDEVVGIEIVQASIEAARGNAAANGISNVSFHVGDARTGLPPILAARGAPRVFVLDPPRSGAGGKVMRRIARSAPERIIYVSCNPTTLARDLQELVPFGYRLTNVVPVDLFPQSYHVETVATLEPGPRSISNGDREDQNET